MATSVDLRNELKQAFRTFGDAAKTWMENETGQVPEEYKEWVQEKVDQLIRDGFERNQPLKQAITKYLGERSVPDDDPEQGRQAGNEFLAGMVETALDNMMCEKTRDTISEYNLVNSDDLSEHISSYLCNHDFGEEIHEYVANMDLDQLCTNVSEGIDWKDMVDDALRESSFFNEAILNQMKKVIENQDEIADLIKPTIHAVIGELLNENIRIKDAVKSSLKEILQDVIR